MINKPSVKKVFCRREYWRKIERMAYSWNGSTLDSSVD